MKPFTNMLPSRWGHLPDHSMTHVCYFMGLSYFCSLLCFPRWHPPLQFSYFVLSFFSSFLPQVESISSSRPNMTAPPLLRTLEGGEGVLESCLSNEFSQVILIPIKWENSCFWGLLGSMPSSPSMAFPSCLYAPCFALSRLEASLSR
jgi:hypothetical protein